jgi:hypothetical protein
MKLFKLFLFFYITLIPLISFGQQLEEDTSYNKNQIGLSISSLNPFAYNIPPVINTYTIFNGNYHSGLGLEASYQRRLSRKISLGGVIGFWKMNPKLGGALDIHNYYASLSKIALSGNYMLSDGMLKPYIGLDISYYYLHYTADSIGTKADGSVLSSINTSGLGIGPSFGLMFSVSPSLCFNVNFSENVILPLNYYSGLWIAPKINMGIVYSFDTKGKK